MQYRKGDIVTLRGRVKHDGDGTKERLFIDVIGSHETLWMAPKDIELAQAHFEIGDRVTWDGGNGEILAISDDHAWIGRGGGDYCTRLFGSIQRSDDIPEGEENAA